MERQRNPCNPRIPPEMEPRRGDGHLVLPIAPSFGLTPLPVFHRPFRARLIGRLLCRGCALTGFTPACGLTPRRGLFGETTMAQTQGFAFPLRAGDFQFAIAPPPACGLTPFQGLPEGRTSLSRIARPGRRRGIHSSCSAGLLVYFFRTPRTDNPLHRLSEPTLISSESSTLQPWSCTASMLALVSSVFVQ